MIKNKSIPLGCMGNKTTELKLLLPIIEPQITNKTIFIEPFCGSCVVSYTVYKNHVNIDFHVNDIDEIRIQFYKNMMDEEKRKELYELEEYSPPAPLRLRALGTVGERGRYSMMQCVVISLWYDISV